MQFAEEHRTQILAELVGMIERWKEAGRPEVDANFRFRSWARIIGGILKVNSFEGFLSNLDESKHDYDPDVVDLMVTDPIMTSPLPARLHADYIDDDSLLKLSVIPYPSS